MQYDSDNFIMFDNLILIEYDLCFTQKLLITGGFSFSLLKFDCVKLRILQGGLSITPRHK